MSSNGYVSNVPGDCISPWEAAYSSVRLRREDKEGMTLSCTDYLLSPTISSVRYTSREL